jgi:peptidoglycan hydrolase CwlO-like protein
MKKMILLAMVMVFCFTVSGFAQDMAQLVPVKEPTLQELQWKALYIQERIKTLQVEFKTLQDSLKIVQDQIKKMTPAPAPKEPEKSKVEPKGKK